jgi:hypothetical protein
MIIPTAFADTQTVSEFGIKVIPGKIVENTEGIIEVYSKTDGITTDKLIATSSDPSIIQIEGVTQDETHMMSIIKIKSISSGDAKIALAAPGFSSNEIGLTVYSDSNIATKLVIKATPSIYATNGPKYGFVAVESVNSNDVPTPVTSDMDVSLSTSDKNIVTSQDGDIVIKKGEYYAIDKIIMNGPGTAQISAYSASMQSVSTSITVNNVDPQNTVQIYVYPKTINAYKASSVYAIVQLHDQSGAPILAKNDIPVTIQITNASGISSINTSGKNPLFQINEQSVIKQGTYWAYVPIQVNAGTNGTFNVVVSTKGSLVSSPASLTSVAKNTLMDTKSARLDSLPILTTGQKELIGVMHLEDPSGNVLIAKSDFKIHVDSSDPSIVSAPDVQMDKGSQSALVFGQIGNTNNAVTLNVVTDSQQSIVPVIDSLSSDTKILKADPLLAKVLTNTNTPIAYYLTKDNSLSIPANDFSLMVSPSDSIKTSTLLMSKNQPILVSDGILLKDGQQTLSVSAPVFSSTFLVDGVSTSPQSVVLDYPDKIIAGIQNTFSVELLYDKQMTTHSGHDILVKLVSNDPSIIDMPETVKIPSGSYFATFTVAAKNEGTSEISLLADEIPLSKFVVNVSSVTPDVSIQSPDFGESGVIVSAEITSTYKQAPLNGLKVDWKVNGAKIQSMDTETNSDGRAKVTMIPSDPGKVHVEASVSGGLYKIVTTSKDITINAPLVASTPTTTNTQQNNLSLFGINPLLFVIPVVAGIAILVFRKKEMFEGMFEKLNLSARIAELKDKVSGMREN